MRKNAENGNKDKNKDNNNTTITITKANTCNNYKLIKTNPQSLKNQQLNINVNEPKNANTNKT